jgi:hypothetical protein
LFNNSGSTGGSANLTFNLNQNLFSVGTNTVFANVTSGLVGIGTSSPTGKLSVSLASATGTGGSGGLSAWDSTYAVFGNTAATSAAVGIGFNTTNGGVLTSIAPNTAWQNMNYLALSHRFYISGAEQMRLDSSGNLGLGVTPSAWASTYTAMQLGSVSSMADTGTATRVTSNGWVNSAGDNKYLTTAAATTYIQSAGQHLWYNAASGTAGNTISFTQAMTLTAAGVLCVGATTNTSRGGSNATLLTYKASGTNYIDIQCGSSGDSGLLFSTASSGNYGLINYRNSAGDLLFYTTSVERMRLTATGLGISESNNPTQALSLYRSGSTNAIMSAGNSGTGLDGTWFGVDTAGNGIVNVRGAFPLLFSTNALERARIDASGNFGVGETSLTERITARKNGAAEYCTIQAKNANSTATLNIGVGGSTVGNTPLQNNAYVINAGNSALVFGTNDAERARITSAGHFRPGADNTYNLGEAAFRWANIYTADLNLSNRDSQNDVDGTWGEWTIQEGENDLYLINRRNGKKFKFMLKEVE